MKNTDLQIIIPKWKKDTTITDKIIKIQIIPIGIMIKLLMLQNYKNKY